jgi:hypothetical protein
VKEVYYQSDGYAKYYVEKLSDLLSMLKVEISEYQCEKGKEELDNLYNNVCKKLEKIKAHQFVECCGYYWGMTEMTEKEFNSLPDFEGF